VAEELIRGAAGKLAAVAAAQGSIDQGFPQETVPVETDARIKKIYVYADSVWSPQSASDYRIVRVKTDAFDLTGWVDFTQARGQDAFTTELRVYMAHTSPGGAHLNTSGFEGGVLAYMQQMTPGANYVSGNWIDVVLRQTSSADNFKTKVQVAYQFIVESR